MISRHRLLGLLAGATLAPSTPAAEAKPRRHSARQTPGPSPIALVVTEGHDFVTFVNLSTGRSLRSLTVGRSPSRIVQNIATNRAYVSNFGAASISIIDVPAGRVVDAIATGNGPAAMAIDVIRNRLLVCNVLDGTIGSIDLKTNASTGSAIVGKHPSSIALDPDGSRAYVANSGDHTLSIIEIAQDGHVVATPVAIEQPADAIFFPPQGREAYLTIESAGAIYIYDFVSKRVTNKIEGLAGPRAIVFDPNGTRAYVAESTTNNVAVLDLGGRAVLSRVAVGMQPDAIAADRALRHLFTADYSGNTLSVVDIARARAYQLSGFDKPRDMVVIG